MVMGLIGFAAGAAAVAALYHLKVSSVLKDLKAALLAELADLKSKLKL